MIPRNHEYIRRLTRNLEKQGVSVRLLKPFHYSTPMNLLKLLIFRAKGYKVIHVHWLYIFPFGFMMKGFYYLSRALGIKVVWEMHNILPHNFSEAQRRASRWFYEKSDAVIYHSERDIERAGELLGMRGHKVRIVIPHGNFNGSYGSSLQKQEARKMLGIPGDKRVILCFGFIRKNRGYEYLTEAAAGMRDTVVVVAGKVMDRDLYRELVKHQETMGNLMVHAGWVPDDEVQVYFSASDVVVLPYTDITTSGVIPLSYAMARPVVTTRIGGIQDVVNERTGILVPPRDAGALKEAIERIFAMDYEAMGRYAREYAEREFDWASNAMKIKSLYAQLVG